MGYRWFRDRKTARVNDDHKVERVKMAEEWEKMLALDPEWPKRVWWSDESIFTLKQGTVGRFGNWYSSSEKAKSHQFIYVDKHPESCMAMADYITFFASYFDTFWQFEM